MKCNEMPEYLVSLLYGEVKPEEESEIRSHLKKCTQCRHAFRELENTSGILSQWEDVSPDKKFVFVHHSESIWSVLRNRISRLRWPVRLSVGIPAFAAVLILALAIFNTRFSRRGGDWELAFGLLPVKTDSYSKADLDSVMMQSNREILQLVARLVQDSEYRQNRELTLTLAQYAQSIEQQRRQDLTMLGRGLEGLQRTTEGRFTQTNDVLNNLIQLTSLKFEKK